MPNRTSYLYQVPRIHEGLEHLLTHDRVFARLSLKPSDIRREYIGPGFPGLVRIVIGQQVSTQAADSLWARFREGVPTVSPDGVLVLNADDMRALGLSHQKARYIRDLATAIKQKNFDPLALDHLTDAQVYEAVTALKGFGPWSAEMFMMFCMARPDVWPSGDLGIQEGLRKYLGKGARPDADKTRKLGKKFAPYRTAAALLLWHIKAMD